MKRIFTLFLLLFSFSTFAFADLKSSCPQAVATNNPSFCPSFKSVSQCHCVEAGMPSGMCQDMDAIYKQMVATYGSMENACTAQHDTDRQTCIDDWNCYRKGGTDSKGRLCSGTGNKCS